MESVIQGGRHWHNQAGRRVGILALSRFVVHTIDWGNKFGYSIKKTNRRGWGYGLSRIWRNGKYNFLGLIECNVEVPGVIKKKTCGFSRGLGLGLKISEDCDTILSSFYGWSFIVSGISNLKSPEGFPKKYVLNPPVSFLFSEIAHVLIPRWRNNLQNFQYGKSFLIILVSW